MTTSRQQILIDSKNCPSPHSLKNKMGRVLWGMVSAILFRPSPRPMHGWRRMLLRSFGARIGLNARIDPTVKIWAPWNLAVGNEGTLGHSVDCYCVAHIEVGSHATVSQYAFLCSATHDIADPSMRMISSPIRIDDQAWVCAGAFIGPGRHVGSGAVVGAYSVVVSDVTPWTVVGGNPAKFLKNREVRCESDNKETNSKLTDGRN